MKHLAGHWFRGGTSKCWLFTSDELTGTPDAIGRTLALAFGSGDPRQLDGVGGATSTTSKAAIVKRSAVPGVDVSYLFAQVGIAEDEVQFTSNCGNCASAVALFALQQGLVKAAGETTAVRMLNENTRTVIRADVETPGGTVPVDGDVSIPGTVRPGVGVDVAFEDVDGTSTGELFPTHQPHDTFEWDGRAVRATCIDAGAPACLVSARDAEVTGAETFAQVETLTEGLVSIRTEASLRMGLTAPGEVPSPAVPKVGLVGAPVDYVTMTGEPVSAADYDISVRMISMFEPHPAIGITSAVAIARAALVDGTVVRDLVPDLSTELTEPLNLRLGTPAGIIVARINPESAAAPMSIGVLRSARRIADADIDIYPRQAHQAGVLASTAPEKD